VDAVTRRYISERCYADLMAKATTAWFTPSPKIIADKGEHDPVTEAGAIEWYLESALPGHILREWAR
jgi:hypothetical protein